MTKQKQKESNESLLEQTELEFYLHGQYNKALAESDKHAKEKCAYGLENLLNMDPQKTVDEVKGRGIASLYGKGDGNYNVWTDRVGAFHNQHIKSLHSYKVSDIIDLINNNSGYKREKIDENAPELTEHYNKTLSEIVKEGNLDKETGRDENLARVYAAITDLYKESVDIKYDRELVVRMGHLGMDETLAKYFPKKEQKQKKTA